MDKLSPSNILKISAFGYNDPGRHFVALSVPAVPSGSDLLMRGRLSAAGIESHLTSANVSVDGIPTGRAEPIKGPAFELSVPAARLKLGFHTAAVMMVPDNAPPFGAEPPFVFEVYSGPATMPAAPGKPERDAAGNIDILDSVHDLAPKRLTNPAVPRGEALLVEGWIFDRKGRTSGTNLILVLDGSRAFSTEHNVPRADVADYFKEKAFRDSGFVAIVPTDKLSPGTHKIDFLLFSNDRKRAHWLPKPVTFSVK